jgi:hypothetical protein
MKTQLSCSGGASLGDPLGNHLKFQVAMRILVDSVDSPCAEPTIMDASKANKARFIEARFYQFFIAVWRGKKAESAQREAMGDYARNLGTCASDTCASRGLQNHQR